MNLISAAAVAEQGGRHSSQGEIAPRKQGGRGQGASESPYPQGEPGPSGRGRVGEQGPSGATHKGPAAQSACGGRQTPLSLLLSPPRLVSISLMLFTSSPNLSKEYGSHVFRFI